MWVAQVFRCPAGIQQRATARRRYWSSERGVAEGSNAMDGTYWNWERILTVTLLRCLTGAMQGSFLAVSISPGMVVELWCRVNGVKSIVREIYNMETSHTATNLMLNINHSFSTQSSLISFCPNMSLYKRTLTLLHQHVRNGTGLLCLTLLSETLEDLPISEAERYSLALQSMQFAPHILINSS